MIKIDLHPLQYSPPPPRRAGQNFVRSKTLTLGPLLGRGLDFLTVKSSQKKNPPPAEPLERTFQNPDPWPALTGGTWVLPIGGGGGRIL